MVRAESADGRHNYRDPYNLRPRPPHTLLLAPAQHDGEVHCTILVKREPTIILTLVTIDGFLV